MGETEESWYRTPLKCKKMCPFSPIISTLKLVLSVIFSAQSIWLLPLLLTRLSCHSQETCGKLLFWFSRWPATVWLYWTNRLIIQKALVNISFACFFGYLLLEVYFLYFNISSLYIYEIRLFAFYGTLKWIKSLRVQGLQGRKYCFLSMKECAWKVPWRRFILLLFQGSWQS